MRTLIIGTAGHIDHGKTSLVRALTGVDLDRLPEERARGITIALGFTHLPLPSGRTASFVDVPGHERLVRTMIAGASGLDAALLCVSAVDGVMPQTREHLAILELLGLRAGVVALTMTDLVDEETVELARMELAETVQGTFLEGAPIVATAAGPQPRGLDELVAALDALPEVRRGDGGLFRLPIDRAFVRRGFGTVVTGTLRSGALADGDEVEILPEGLRARVRGLQVHGEPVRRSRAGLRTAVNLAGIERDDLARGMVLTHPGTVEPASILDVRYRHLPDAAPLSDGARVRLLAGTAEVMAVLSLLEGGDALQPGTEALVQLRTEHPVVALPGDRVIVRRESPVTTLGGGTILDPWSRRARRRERPRLVAELRALEAGDRRVFLARAGDRGLDGARLRACGLEPGEAVRLGDRHLHPDIHRELVGLLLDALAAWHRAHPLLPGAPRSALAAGRLGRLGDRAFLDLLQGLVDAGRVVADGPRYRLPDFAVRLDDENRRRADALAARVAEAGFAGLDFAALVREDADLVTFLVDSGRLVRAGSQVLEAGRVAALERAVRDFLAAHEAMSPTDFKTLTGLTRRHAIPLLEWLDARGLTERRGDVRVLSGKAAAEA